MSDSLVTSWTVACRLLCPWDPPGKNTGVGCHFLLQGIFLTQGSKSCLLCLQQWKVDPLPLSHLGSPLLLTEWFGVKYLNTLASTTCKIETAIILNIVLWGVKRILSQLSQKGSPRILKWVAYPFSSGSFWPRNCGFFTNWIIREVQ